ncbi:hypothetical protein Fcan01_18837 [Folsomia candida]|uniref:Uncharacterized protein n=1 Tax=Folsomia candida TaxID=158441 RepID=A0A226DM97_FOLCA|nr:hypothetical protein Fcan01_18837 [Folsomia candida]
MTPCKSRPECVHAQNPSKQDFFEEADPSPASNPKLSGSASGPKNLIPKFRVRVGFGFRLTTRNPNQQEFFATTNAKKLKKKIKVLTTLAKTVMLPSGSGSGPCKRVSGSSGSSCPRVSDQWYRVLRVRVALGFRISGIGFGFGFRICKNPTRFNIVPCKSVGGECTSVGSCKGPALFENATDCNPQKNNRSCCVYLFDFVPSGSPPASG